MQRRESSRALFMTNNTDTFVVRIKAQETSLVTHRETMRIVMTTKSTLCLSTVAMKTKWIIHSLVRKCTLNHHAIRKPTNEIKKAILGDIDRFFIYDRNSCHVKPKVPCHRFITCNRTDCNSGKITGKLFLISRSSLRTNVRKNNNLYLDYTTSCETIDASDLQTIK